MHTQNLCSVRKSPKKFILSLVPTGGDEMDTLFLKNFCPFTCLKWESVFGGVLSKKLIEKTVLSLIPTEKEETATLFQKN